MTRLVIIVVVISDYKNSRLQPFLSRNRPEKSPIPTSGSEITTFRDIALLLSIPFFLPPLLMNLRWSSFSSVSVIGWCVSCVIWGALSEAHTISAINGPGDDLDPTQR